MPTVTASRSSLPNSRSIAVHVLPPSMQQALPTSLWLSPADTSEVLYYPRIPTVRLKRSVWVSCPHTSSLPVCQLLCGLFSRLFRASDLGTSLFLVLFSPHSALPLGGAHSPHGFSSFCTLWAPTRSHQLLAGTPELLPVCQSFTGPLTWMSQPHHTLSLSTQDPSSASPGLLSLFFPFSHFRFSCWEREYYSFLFLKPHTVPGTQEH